MALQPPVEPGTRTADQPAPWTERRRATFMGAFAAFFLLLALGLFVPKPEPNIVLEARSHAVVFMPSRTLDLVRSLAPRHGLEPGGTPFTGLRFTPPVDNNDALRSFAGESVAAQPEFIHSLQRLEVTPGCAVRLEHYVDSMIRLDIERPVSASGACRVSADLTLAGKTGWLPVEVRRPVVLGAPATLVFQPSHAPHFRNVPVSAISFETSDTGLVRSAIVNARLELPDIGHTGENAPAAHVGDAVTLGELKGNIVEMVVADTIRTVFKGTASRPAVGRRDLRPPVLQHLAHTHWRLVAAFVIAGLTFVGLLLPKARQ